MSNPIFTGAGVALITPMNQDGSVNYEKLDELVEYQIQHKTDAIIACGTTGESSTLTHEEHVKVIEAVVKKTAGRVPVIAGTGSNDTAFAIEISKQAEEAGADALLMVTPYYNKTSQRGLVQHYFAVADSVNIPIILYNVPSRTGVNILPETYAQLAKHKNIVATKEANGDISAAMKTISLCGDDLYMYVGNDDQITPFTAIGAKGVISVLSNVLPEAAHDIAVKGIEGDIKASLELQLKYLDICNDLFIDVNPIPVKEAMNYMGLEVGPLRLPLYPMSDENAAKLKATLSAHGLI